MKYKKIVCLDYTGKELTGFQWQQINRLCAQRKLVTKNNLESHLQAVDCLLLKLGASVGKELIDKAPKLRYIGMLGTGYGRLDVEYAKQKGITVCNIAGYSTEGVAEFAFGILLEHLREIGRAKLQAEKENYSESSFTGYEIKDKNFSIIGLGRIGGRIAEIASKGFGAKVSYWSKHRKKEFEKIGIEYKKIGQLLKQSDFITLNLAFNPLTKQFLDKEKINLIKPGCVVLNLAPMELVDVNALVNRLKKNDITFILDHSDELSKEQAKKLLDYKNCIMYPPIAYVTREATQIKNDQFVKNLENFLRAKPTNRVN